MYNQYKTNIEFNNLNEIYTITTTGDKYVYQHKISHDVF